MFDLAQRLQQLGNPRILVFGDLMLDRYTWGSAERISPEAPVVVLQADQEEIRPGGAASVAYLLRHLEADVTLAGVVGDDVEGRTLRALLVDEGIDDQLVLVDATRPTTVKQRFVGRASDRHPHQILRVDRESRAPLSAAIAGQLWHHLQLHLHRYQAILIADYLKGTCQEQLLSQMIDAARTQGIPVLIDPGRLSNYDRYRGATLLKPNRLEAELVEGKTITTPEQAGLIAGQLCRSFDIQHVMITLDRDGLVVASETAHHTISSSPREVYDITGAGDMVLAALGLCMAGGMNLADAAEIANQAAGLEVERVGVAPVSRFEITSKLSSANGTTRSKVITAHELVRVVADYRRTGKRIVFTNGCFDLLHLGHVTSLEEAATYGEVLIVGVNSDASVKRLKGESRPVIPERDRVRMLAALGFVGHVLIFDEDTPQQLLELIRPDVLVKGGTTAEIVGWEIVESYGGRVFHSEAIADLSTTQLIQRIGAAKMELGEEVVR